MASIQVSVGDYFTSPPDLVVSLEFDEANAWDVETCLGELESLVTLNDVLFDGHALNVRLDNTSWGFDASAAEVLLYVSTWLIEQTINGAAAAGVAAVISRIAQKLQPGEPSPISREDAIEAAKGRVLTAYGSEKRRQLKVVGESELIDPAGWEIHLSSTSGSDYTVAVRGIEGSSVRQTVVSRRSRS